MKITISPENEVEKNNMKAIEHVGVKEFMLFGNRKDIDGLLVDFHEWSGQYRYLIGGMHYFSEVINDERKERVRSVREQETANSITPQNTQMKLEAKSAPNLKVVSIEDNDYRVEDADDVGDDDIPNTEPELEAKVEAIQKEIDGEN